MPITPKDLTVPLDHVDRQQLLADWRWLIGPSRQPIIVSAIGDAFVQDEHDGTVHLLDTAAGVCDPVARDADEFRALLSDAAWVTEHLAVEMVAALLASDIRLGPGEVYSWKHPPALGGDIVLDNIAPADMVVHFSTTGQIHEQIKDLPPGTPIGEIRLRDPE